MDIQDGFTYPYFTLTHAVLDDLELALSEDDKPSRTVHYFNPRHDAWIKIKLGGVIELTKPLQTLFFQGHQCDILSQALIITLMLLPRLSPAVNPISA